MSIECYYSSPKLTTDHTKGPSVLFRFSVASVVDGRMRDIQQSKTLPKLGTDNFLALTSEVKCNGCK